MLEAEFDPSLDVAVLEAKRWLGSLEQRPVRPEVDATAMLDCFDGELPGQGERADAVVRMLAEGSRPGLMAVGSGRFSVG